MPSYISLVIAFLTFVETFVPKIAVGYVIEEFLVFYGYVLEEFLVFIGYVLEKCRLFALIINP